MEAELLFRRAHRHIENWGKWVQWDDMDWEGKKPEPSEDPFKSLHPRFLLCFLVVSLFVFC